jgi:uncharacterized protein (DUF433 family)
MDYRVRIIRDPQVCGGEPVIKGTRVTLRTVLASLAEGDSLEEILEAFPTLTSEDVRAVIAFAAASAEEDLPVPALPYASRKSNSTRTFLPRWLNRSPRWDTMSIQSRRSS